MSPHGKSVTPAAHEPSTISRPEVQSLAHLGKARVAGSPFLATILGAVLAIGFYALVLGLAWFGPTEEYSRPLQRYFLGHPVAIAATMLFWFALAMLVAKWLGVVAEKNQLDRIRDSDLLPSGEQSGSPAGRWLQEKDAGHVARNWITELARLPDSTRLSHLLLRLEEVLTRQSQRGSAKHLSDDLRELSARDADAAHDSLGLVRIIVWAIPMLGFLGTVIGITQTLGGLDFSNGSAAVDNLKSGLYVAFDTTAIGLVLSVLAIFLQFPVERSEQRMLAAIDARVGHLVSSTLPSDEASDNQTVLIADLCRGVQAAVAESLDNQAKLWRDTIDSAQTQWQSVHEKNNNTIADAFELTLAPALLNHAKSISESSGVAGDRLSTQCDRWQQTLDRAEQAIITGLKNTLNPALLEHASALNDSAHLAADQWERQCKHWQETIGYTCDTLASQQQSLVNQFEALTETHSRAEVLTAVQQSLDANLATLIETNTAIERNIAASRGDGLADAMRILARAVDVLSTRLAESPDRVTDQSKLVRRVA